MLEDLPGQPHFNSFDELHELVSKHQGILTVSMGSLRNAYGVARLGVHVRSAIQNELSSRGLGHDPYQLPLYQESTVRVFKLGSPMADLIQAFQLPTWENDEKLRRLLSRESEEILQKIRALVCD